MASTKTATPLEDGELRALTIKDFCQRIGVSPATAYNLMARGDLKTFTVGKRRLVPVSELKRLIAGAR